MLEVSSSDGGNVHSAPDLVLASLISLRRSIITLIILAVTWLGYFGYVCTPLDDEHTLLHYMIRLTIQAPLLAIHTGTYILTSADQRLALSHGFVSLYSSIGHLKHISHYFAVGGVLFSICVGAGWMGEGYHVQKYGEEEENEEGGNEGEKDGKDRVGILLICVVAIQAIGVILCSSFILAKIILHNKAIRINEGKADAISFLGVQTSGRSVCEAQEKMIEILREKRDQMRRDLTGISKDEGFDPSPKGLEGKVRALRVTQETLGREAQALAIQEETIKTRVSRKREELQHLHVIQ